jgi:teichuronic acid exporter
MAAFREVLSFGLGVHAKRLLEYAAQNLDSLTVGRVMGMTGLGLYDKAFNTMDRFRERLTIAPGVSLRIFAMIHEEPGRFRAAYRKVQLSVSLISLPFFVGLAIAADAFVVVAFGHRWLPSAPLLRVMCLVGFLKVYLSYASAVVQAVGQVWQEVWRQLLYAILVVAGIVMLAPLGILGASLGVLGATCIMAVLMVGLVGRMTSLTWREQMAPLAPGTIASLIVALAVAVTDAALSRVAGREAYVVRLVADSALGGGAWAWYVLATRRSDVRLLVEETLTDMSPALGRFLPRRSAS